MLPEKDQRLKLTYYYLFRCNGKRRPATTGLFWVFPSCYRCLFEKKFFFKILCFFIIISNCFIYKNFLIFSRKNLTDNVERYFKEELPFDTHYTKKLPNLENLKKFKVFFKKNHLFFVLPKTTKFWTFWEISLFQSHNAANLLQFGKNKFSRWETWKFWPTSFLAWTQLANIA